MHVEIATQYNLQHSAHDIFKKSVTAGGHETLYINAWYGLKEPYFLYWTRPCNIWQPEGNC